MREERLTHPRVALAIGLLEVDPGEAVELPVDEAGGGHPSPGGRWKAHQVEAPVDHGDVAGDPLPLDQRRRHTEARHGATCCGVPPSAAER